MLGRKYHHLSLATAHIHIHFVDTRALALVAFCMLTIADTFFLWYGSPLRSFTS